MKFTVSHQQNTDPATFWATYFDPAYQEKLYLEGMGADSFTIVSQEGDVASGQVSRTVEATQSPPMPNALRKVFGASVTTTEVGTFDGDEFTFDLEQSTTDKIKVHGRMRVDDNGDGTCTQHIEMDVKAKIPLVGGQVEKFIKSQTEDSQAKAAKFTNDYLG